MLPYNSSPLYTGDILRQTQDLVLIRPKPKLQHKQISRDSGQKGSPGECGVSAGAGVWMWFLIPSAPAHLQGQAALPTGSGPFITANPDPSGRGTGPPDSTHGICSFIKKLLHAEITSGFMDPGPCRRHCP